METIRPLRRGDIPAITSLHRRTFGNRKPEDELSAYLTEIFCNHPWPDESLPSLVCEDEESRIVGCLGVMPRPMLLHDQPVRAAVSHNFMIAPECRGRMIAIKLMKAFFSGPQDLCLADAFDLCKQLWARFGGRTLYFHSLRWLRVLRPAESALWFASKIKVPRTLIRAFSFWSHGLDAGLVRLPRLPFHLNGSASPRELDEELLLKQLDRFSTRFALRPHYDGTSVKWLSQVLNRRADGYLLRKASVQNAKGEIIGWYIYYACPEGIGEVVQYGARSDSMDAVLACLFRDAYDHRTIALAGQVDPQWGDALPRNHCFFDHADTRILVHSRRPSILDALYSGNAFLTRLEGESWIRLAF